MDIKIYCEKWLPGNGERCFNKCDFIIEAFDQAKNKQQFIEYYQDKAKYLISCNGIAGISIKKEIKIKKTGNIFFVGDGTTGVSVQHPAMAPKVIACASLMAGIILDICTSKKEKKQI